MEELEYRQLAAVGHRHEWRREIECVAHDVADVGGLRIAFDEGPQHDLGHFGQRGGAIEGRERNERPGFRHVQATVGREPLGKRLTKANRL
jgi:hypothetical protein